MVQKCSFIGTPGGVLGWRLQVYSKLSPMVSSGTVAEGEGEAGGAVDVMMERRETVDAGEAAALVVAALVVASLRAFLSGKSER